MPTDATGTPTSLGIRKYNTSVDAPSGLGFNGAMDDIDALLIARVSKPAGILTGEFPVWNGTTWVRSSVIAPPSTELVYQLFTTDQTTASTSYVDMFTFSAATFENAKYYLEVAIPNFRCSIPSGAAVMKLMEGASQIGNVVQFDTHATGGVGVTAFARIPFTPSAASHTYKVQWAALFASTLTIAASASNAVFRIVKA